MLSVLLQKMKNPLNLIKNLLFLILFLLYLDIAVTEDQQMRQVSTQMSRTTLQKLFLDVLSGRQVGPSGDNTVEPKFELNKTAVAQSVTSIPIEGIFQGNGAPCVPIVRDILTKDTKDTYVVLVRAARLRPLINIAVWTCALMYATLHTPSMQQLAKPSFLELLPYRSLPLPVIEAAVNQAGESGKQGALKKLVEWPASIRVSVVILMTLVGTIRLRISEWREHNCPVADGRYGEINGINNRVWYYKEDIEMNVQHWFWHLSYPSYVLERIRPYRRGELFYYMHQQLLARYNAELLANGLPITKPYQVSSNSIVAEAYAPYISHPYIGQYWPSRGPNSKIDYNGKKGENIPGFVASINAAIDAKALTNANGEIVKLTDFEGIDLLSDAVESSLYSADRKKYGNVHGHGHVLISLLGNATEKFGGVMIDLATSIRDPAFFRWHTFINDIFGRHKHLLEPYQLGSGDHKLVWKGVNVELIAVYSSFALGSGSGTTKNSLETHWSYRKLDISHGVVPFRKPGALTDYNGSLPVCLKYMNHRKFEYRITIVSTLLPAKATVRIYLAPKFNLDGKLLELEDQRHLFAILDTFTTKRINLITRRSMDSTVTRTFMKSFAQLEQEVARGRIKKPLCGCGLPHNLLLPRGTEAGMVFDLFVMVTNGDEDADGILGDQSNNFCTAPYHWCGRPGQKYPDKKPLAYPFDRLPPFAANRRRVKSIDEFSGLIPNSKTIQVTITHKNR